MFAEQGLAHIHIVGFVKTELSTEMTSGLCMHVWFSFLSLSCTVRWENSDVLLTQCN